MAVRFGVIFITDNYTIDSVSQISQYQISYYCNFLQIFGKKIISNAFDLSVSYCFITDVGNPSHLAIKVPRKSLENDELPNTKKNIFNGLIKTIYGCIDDENAFLELENDKTINDLNLQDLLGQLKTQAFPLSDIFILILICT
ncbi:hypothetical protein HpHA106_13180 [Helicobacter pylori]